MKLIPPNLEDIKTLGDPKSELVVAAAHAREYVEEALLTQYPDLEIQPVKVTITTGVISDRLQGAVPAVGELGTGKAYVSTHTEFLLSPEIANIVLRTAEVTAQIHLDRNGRFRTDPSNPDIGPLHSGAASKAWQIALDAVEVISPLLESGDE